MQGGLGGAVVRPLCGFCPYSKNVVLPSVPETFKAITQKLTLNISNKLNTKVTTVKQ